MVYIFPYIFALLYWILFFVLANIPEYAGWVALGLLFLVIFSAAYISRFKALSHWHVWFNILLYVISSFGLVLIIGSEGGRNVYILISGLLGGVLVYVITAYFKQRETFFSRIYLEFISFIYLLTFWQVSVWLFFGLVSYDVPLWTAMALLLPVTYVLSRGVIQARQLDPHVLGLSMFGLILTVMELMYFIQLLPLHYLVLATILTIWFFYVLELIFITKESSNRSSRFKLYTVLTLVAIIALLLTSKWG